MMKQLTKNHLFTLIAALAGVGCCPCYSGYPASKGAIQALAQALPEAPRNECELRLYIEHTNADGVLGMSAVEVSTNKLADGSKPAKAVTDGVCVKHIGAPLELPSRIVMAAKDMTDFDPICDGKQFALPDDERSGCVWNHTFRNRYPFTFTFVANDGKISDHLSLVRVYRNGSLIARYNAASQLQNDQVLTLEADEIKVPSHPFVTYPPHLAALDLRILPAGATIDESLLSETVVDYAERAKERAKLLLDAAAQATDPALKPELTCASSRIQRLKAQAEAIIDKSVVVPSLDPACGAADVTLPKDLTSVRELYGSKKAAIKQQLSELTTKELEQLSLIKDALPKVRSAIADKLKNETKALAALDKQIEAAAQSCDDALAVAQRLRSTARDVMRNKETQARIYEASVAAMEQQGGVFEQYKDNPPPLPDERQLDMHHGQRFQGYMFSPWNGLPVSVAPGGSFGELQLASAIPILDVAGFRFQWSKSRFADFRAAVGCMYFSDEVPVTKQTTDAMGVVSDEATTEKRFHGALQANLGLANFKFGMAWVPGTTQPGARNKFENEFRLLVGSDLLKLILGNNVEAL
jgi:hypothetical protein